MMVMVEVPDPFKGWLRRGSPRIFSSSLSFMTKGSQFSTSRF